MSRESSTSLVAHGDDDEEPVQYASITPRSTRTSRAPSRMTSAKQSRRGSKAGSRADLTYFATPAGQRENELSDYFGDLKASLSGPDFVDVEDESESDGDDDDAEENKMQEEEVRRLTDTSAVGGFVNRLLDWSLGEESDDEATSTPHTQTQRQVTREQGPRLDNVPNSDAHATAVKEARVDVSTKTRPRKGEEEPHGWADAAWLLSVASKVLL